MAIVSDFGVQRAVWVNGGAAAAEEFAGEAQGASRSRGGQWASSTVNYSIGLVRWLSLYVCVVLF